MKFPVKRWCIVCEKPLTGVQSGEHEQEFNEAPDDALVFTAHGNYGSRLFDPGPRGGALEVSICDNCVKERSRYVLHFRVVNRPPEIVSAAPFSEEPT